MINLSTYERAWRCARADHPDGTREVTMRALRPLRLCVRPKNTP